MPNTDLAKNDPLIASMFWLEIDGAAIAVLSEVSGLEIEIEVVEMKQSAANGQLLNIKSIGQNKAPAELSIKRMAPLDIDSDPIWKWFNDIHEKGMAIASRADKRKNGSVVVYDASNAEVARWNFYNGFPSKIASDGFSVTSTDPVYETISLTIERLERKK